jgi:hypothetical protein
MATLPKEEPKDGIHEVTKEGPEPSPAHTFNAAAHVLTANLEHPVTREVEREAHVRLRPDGTYKFQPTGPMRLEGILSYESGYTQVGGHKSPKEGHGFVTLTTSAVEGLNILDVLTADRVVGQISTEHPVWDHRQPRQVPTVTFLGTRFENLRIDGHRVELETQFDILGTEPKEDTPYLENEEVLKRVSAHYDSLPDWAKDEKFGWGQAPGQPYGDMKCSLVQQIDKKRGIPVGHVIDLPHFGKIFLAELTVNRKKAEPIGNGHPNPETYHFHLEMIRVELGCLAQGTATVVALSSNGTGSGGGGGGH